MFGAQGRWLCFSERFRFLRTRSLCSSSSKTTNNPKTTSTTSTSTNPPNKNDIITDERYRQLENLDMIAAAKMLFTDPPKKKKFGLDFHLVQLFFACLPSLAVYLVAQYARYDMRKMEAEVEQKRKKRDEEEAKKAEEEAKEKEKEMELNPPEEKKVKSDPRLLEVKMRLEKLEEAVKEIVVETKKQSNTNLAKNQVTDAEKKQLNSSAPSDTSNIAASNKAVEGDGFGKHNSLKAKPELGEERKGSIATPNSSLQDPKGQHQGGGASSASMFRSLRKTLTQKLQHHQHQYQNRLQLCNFQKLQIARRTYITDMRKSAFEGNISRLLRCEIQYELQSSPPKQPITKFDSFMLDGRPGERWIRLKRQYADEDIKIEATMFDGAAPAPSASASGGVANVDDMQLHITLIVSISKGEGDGVLEIVCSCWPDSIEINRLFVNGNKKMLAEPYAGPEFKELDDELQDSLYDFLEVRGINDQLAVFLHEYMKNKDKAEFIKWMERVKSFIERK